MQPHKKRGMCAYWCCWRRLSLGRHRHRCILGLEDEGDRIAHVKEKLFCQFHLAKELGSSDTRFPLHDETGDALLRAMQAAQETLLPVLPAVASQEMPTSGVAEHPAAASHVAHPIGIKVVTAGSAPPDGSQDPAGGYEAQRPAQGNDRQIH